MTPDTGIAIAIAPRPSIASIWIVTVAAIAAPIRIITARTAIAAPITIAPFDKFALNVATLIDNASSIAAAP